jgi:hypothetical protein
MLVESESGSACVYPLDEELVIEGGFECPSGFRHRSETSTAITCSERPMTSLPPDACVRRDVCGPQVEPTSSHEPFVTPIPEDVAAPLPPIALTVRGAFGFCPQQGQALNATIESTEDGSGARIEAEIFDGFEGSCEGDDCLLTHDLDRVLTVSELAELRRLLDAVPEEACTPGPNPVCDPCLTNVVSLDGEAHYVDGCSFIDTCPGTVSALFRIIGLIQRIVEDVIPPRPPNPCLSPANFTSAAEGIPGCLCDLPGQSVCTQDAVVYCAPGDGTSYTYWKLVDNDCDLTCAPEDVLEGIEECLASNVWCSVLPDGTVCR